MLYRNDYEYHFINLHSLQSVYERGNKLSSKTDDLIGIISRVVIEWMKYAVPRMGIVSKIDDPEGKGRVLVHIPAFNWMTDDVGAWCFPIDKKSLVTPEVGSWVIVQWIDGNENYPIYTGIDSKMKDMLPDAYVDENSQVIFENQNRDFAIVYDESGGVLNIGAADESFVKGDTAKIEMDKDQTLMNSLQTVLAAWTPVAGDGGLALKTALTAAGFFSLPQANYANILSTKIKGE